MSVITTLARTHINGVFKNISVPLGLPVSSMFLKSSKRSISQQSTSIIEENSFPLPLLSKAKPITTNFLPVAALRLPTLERNLGVSIYNPLIKPYIERQPSLTSILEKLDPVANISIEEPSQQVNRKEAARLVVIRKRKMRRHRMRKYRVKMKFVTLKRRQKREYAKEKAFQAGQMEIIYAAEAFDPVAHVNHLIAKTKQVPEPTTWKGKRLPKAVIKILIENDGKWPQSENR